MSENKRIRKEVTTKPIFIDGKPKIWVLTTTFEYDQILRRWQKVNEEVTYEDVEKHGLVKSLEVNAILIKQTQSQTLFEGIETQFFLTTFKFAVPRDKKQDVHTYLYLEPDSMAVSRNMLEFGFSNLVDFNDSEYCTMIGEPKQISKDLVEKLLKEKKVYPKFLMKHSGSFAVVVIAKSSVM